MGEDEMGEDEVIKGNCNNNNNNSEVLLGANIHRPDAPLASQEREVRKLGR